MENNVENVEEQFKRELLKIYEASSKTILMKKDQYFNLIEEIKLANTSASKNRRQYYILKR
jgi:hypothetical protein